MEELNSGPPKTNPSSGREEDLNPGPLDYKSSALTTRPRVVSIDFHQFLSILSIVNDNCLILISDTFALRMKSTDSFK